MDYDVLDDNLIWDTLDMRSGCTMCETILVSLISEVSFYTKEVLTVALIYI